MGYKITPIDGDLVVSRNAEVGGNMDIHGNARVAGSLKVEGFLDAPHIKGAAKGLFNSVEELTREYPNPRPGWFAIVLDATNKEMGILYKAENRGWVATTDEARPYEFIMDSINVFASKDEVAEITAEVSKALDEKVDKSSIVHTTGDSAEKVMSQESISKSIVANASVFKTFDSSVQMADIALAFIKDIRIYTDTPKEISLFLLSRNGNDYKMQFAYTDEAEGVYYMQYNGPINDDCCVISGNGFLAHIYVNKNALPDGVQVSNMGRKAFVLSSSCFFTNDRLLGLDAKVAENKQKIDELKGRFTVDTVVEDFSVEKDTYIDYYNGATKSFEGYELRKYPVEEGTTISVCVEGVTFDAAAAMYAIYSDDSVMDETTLLNLGPALSPANNGKHTLNIPAGSRVLALSVWKQDTTVAYSVTESRSSVEGYVDSRANKAAAVETARAKKAEEELNTRIDESLGGISFGLTDAGVYVDMYDNKGDAKGEPILIPTADIGGMGFMSRGDKTYLDSLDNEGELEVEFTESNYSFKLSSEGYDDIPKGVHIQIKSDTITELIGLYQGTDRVIEQTLVDGTITEGVIFRIKNKEETGNVTIKYTGQIAELLSRLQGISEESSASTDPFRFLGEFLTPNSEELQAALNNLHSTNKADGYEGIWRFNVQGKPSTLYNLALDYTKDKWLQGLITIYSPSSNPNNVFSLNNKINILYRIYENEKWSTWRSITQDNADAIAAETARAKKVEEELRQTAVTKKRNYIHATSTEAYIISKYNNKYDIIIHFAKTLANNLYTIESVYLVNNTNTELSTDITREPVYRFCQQQTSDMIGPVSVRTGIDGLSWVGGNHFHKTQDSDVKTAETETFIVNADDTAIGNGRMYAEKITIRVKNKIYDPNVEPVSGAKILSSKLIDEFVTYTIDGGEVLVSVEHRYVKDIYVGAYYGMQSMFTQYSQIITNTLTDWKDKVDKDSSYSIPKGDVIDFNRFSQKHLKNNEEVFYQNTILLPYGIGKHQLVKDGAQVFIESGSKAYHVLIKQQDIKANDVLSWMGIYSWKTPLIDNEYNYIYTYSDNNGENISVTAKQVYENKIVPVSPSLANKAYESDGIVKVDDIIGYNIVLSANNVGSSIIKELTKATEDIENNAKAISDEENRAKKAEEELNTRIDESLGGYDISIMSAGLYFDKVNNKGERFGDPILIPTADIGGMGLMSRGDKTYLDSLDNEGELEVEFTESNYSFKLSSEGYDDIPKGVHIQIKSDTITELIGYYAGQDGGYVPQTLVDGAITEGVIVRISNKEETGNVTIKYTGQIAELLSRLQGISEESSASTDPFRFLGEFSDPTKKDLHDALNSLHSTNRADGYEGIWRFTVLGKPSTLYNLALNYNEDKWLQGLVTIYSPNSNPDYVFSLNNKINILYRIHERTDDNENGKWSTWRSITQDNADAIAAETARAKKVEEELRQTAVTKKRNYIHATSTEAYIISKYNNKYDIIIHFAKTLKNELYTIESVYLVNNTNTELSTDINREPVYRFCQQQTSDMIGPVSVRTGIDGLSWVGGNHLHKTQDSDVKTAETETFIVNADDTAIGNGRMYAEKITIRVKNKIYDPNVEPVSGAKILSSKLIDEFVTYTIDGGEVLVSVEHRYVKDIYVGAYYGMQSMFTQYSQIITNTLTDWKDKVDKDSSYSIPKGDVIDFNRFSQKHLKNNEEVFYQNTILLPYGIGKHQLVKDGAQVFIESGSKAYHVLIKQQDIKANDVLSWMGIYSWKTPLIDNEYNYIYTYSDNNGENISVTAKQVYENKIVPVSPSLANKAYESDGIVKVDDIIGYNIVLSTENVGSSIIRVDDGIRVATTENDGLMSADDKVKLNASIKNVDVSPNTDDVELDLEDNTDRITHVVFPAATTEKAGVMSAEDKDKLDKLGSTKVTWDSSSNMNDFKTPGVYEIYGERTVKTDNLPITNDGSGHSISARLTVVASTLQPANNEICVTQFLQLSNRVGGDGATYVRTYNENNNSMNGWSAWQKQMGLVETLINSDDTTVGQEIFSGAAQKIGNGLNGMIDNGMYSGIYIDNLNYTGTSSLYYLSAQPTFVETFVLVVINDYAASGTLKLPRHITQLKYAVDAITGQSTVKKRVGTGDDSISWSDWENINNITIDDEVTTASVNPVQSQAIASAIEEGEKRVLIAMYRLIGASYNQSNDTFTFNTVSGLSWSEMGATFVNRDLVYRLHLPRAGQSISNLRVLAPLTNILTSPAIKIEGLNTFYTTGIKLLALYKLDSTNYDTYLNSVRTDFAPVCTYMYDTFRLCSALKVVFPINLKGCKTLKKESFAGCVALEELRLLNLPLSLNLDDSPLISKASILYIIANAAPNSVITITLHADAYVRLSEDTDVVAALEAQPLITLVSA